MKLLGSTKDIIDADKNSENVPMLFTFVPNKQYGQLITTFISFFKNYEYGFFRNRYMVYGSKQ